MKFKTILEETSSVLVEKKSKFIAQVWHVESREEAENKIQQIKKQYADARHNCYAYCVLEEEQLITKSSDNGEPSGTAGVPILNVIVNQGLVNVLVVVTRYFGGILLGTGGLVRAYSNATSQAIAKGNVIQMQKGWLLKIETEYPDWGSLKHYLQKRQIRILQVLYHQTIEVLVEATQEEVEKLEEEHSEVTKYSKNVVRVSEKYIEVQK